MKQGKCPTKRQAILIKTYGLKHENWLIIKNLPGEMHLKHRETGRVKVLQT